MSSEQGAARVASQNAIATADAAVTKYPAKAPLAHHGAYDTISDAYGNRFPVVRIGDKWVPLTEDSLRESRKKAPPLNFGLAGKLQGTTSNKNGSSGTTAIAVTSSIEMITANGGQSPADTTDMPFDNIPCGPSPPSAATYVATTTVTSQLSSAAAAAATSQQPGFVKTQESNRTTGTDGHNRRGPRAPRGSDTQR